MGIKGIRFKRTRRAKIESSKDLSVITLPTETGKEVIPQLIHIHEDIAGLIWYADSRLKNIDPYDSVKRVEKNNCEYSFFVSGMEEPSMIFTKHPIEFTDDFSKVPKPDYYPTYHGLEPLQKGIYIRYLENPYRQDVEICYTFLLYYGLERHLLVGDWQQALKVIFKLREVHKNKSFQNYSARALVLYAILKGQGEIALATISTLGDNFLPVTEYFLCASSFNLHITSREIMYYAEWFGFHNTRYIKMQKDLFSKTLSGLIYIQYGRDYLLVSDILTDKDIQNMPTLKLKVFANTSLSDTRIEAPQMSEDYKLRKFMCDLLLETHDNVKSLLAEQRKRVSKCDSTSIQNK